MHASTEPKNFRHPNLFPMKKKLYDYVKAWHPFSIYLLSVVISLNCQEAAAQSCPANASTSIATFPNTYYPANQANVAAGAMSIALGAVSKGITPISSGDIVMVIQMQGAQINSNNNSNYGSGSGTGSGYKNNANLLAGNMEYMVATNSVPLTGGTLNILSGLTNSYKNTPFGTDGQYTYQVVRVPVYYDALLSASITAPRWDGATGGVIVIYATNNINLNTYTIDASGLGFRGGGGRAFNGSGSGSSSDFITNSSLNANGGKGEGIAGTPKYLNDNNTFLDVSATEGYPNGSYGKGAPGNAGGGGTDGNPSSDNDQNTGGGGGANGGPGGGGGWAWSSATTSGGRPGAIFAQTAADRLVMGGGGGAGTTNNGTGNPGSGTGFASSGAAGGGIVILQAMNKFTGSGTIKANGGNANSTVLNDGSGGAGAGGTILIYSANGGTGSITATAKGGNGGNNQVAGGDSHGPGGGGGGGIIYSNSGLAGASSVAGGNAGTTSGLTTTYGATAGSGGLKVTNIAATAPAQVPLHCIILALSFIDVAATQGNGVVNINWEVSSEINTREYVVERSSDGINFSAIGSVAYQTATNSNNKYEYPDNNGQAVGGTLYYRIREVETSGNAVYSKVVSVRMNGLTSPFSVYPNPAKNTVTVSFSAATPGAISLRLFDLAGSLLWQQQYQASMGPNTVQIDRVSTLPNGVYILQWFDGLRPQQVKLMVNH
jgi:hypothetical protein